MKKVLSIIAVTLMVAGLTGCCSMCGKDDTCTVKKECPEGCTKACCTKPAE